MTEFANVTERELFPCGKIIRDSKEHFHYDLLCSNKHGREEAQQLRPTQKTARAMRVYLPLLPCFMGSPSGGHSGGLLLFYWRRPADLSPWQLLEPISK